MRAAYRWLRHKAPLFMLGLYIGVALALAWGLTGCTAVMYRDFRAIDVLRHRSVELTLNPSGATVVKYNVTTDAQDIAPIIKAAVQGAVEGAK